ncbi:DNA polymerase lambda-like isoform X1 [Schistocerca americana]|uniref:DNA polymerase lambda-like isoform X1 n=1 Tax=Schistocerca americana TaxID=7009 RepID=UPI001F4FEAE9|nr:DNA polymerase lambda-like isoform X1 [Schistocerca americana]
MESRPQQIFADRTYYILPARIGNTRLTVLRNNIQKMGGTVTKCAEKMDSSRILIIVDESFLNKPDKCYEILKSMHVDCFHVEIVTTKWLSSCLKERKLLDTEPFMLHLEPEHGEKKNNGGSNISQNQPSIERESALRTNLASDERCMDEPATQSSPPKKQKTNTEKFAALQTRDKEVLYNGNIIAELEKLSSTFRSCGDQWRAHGYDKAIASIKSHGKNINTYEEAISLPGIGKKMAEKIMEIIETGKLQKVDEVCNSEKSKIISLFTQIWGVGPAIAQSWYAQGFRTLEDLPSKANLSKQQKIGLHYFEELQCRIPREEVECIGNIVKENALAIETDISVILCGSYRRGKPTCGDIDVLLLVEVISNNFLVELLKRLRACGLVTDDLMNIEESGGHKKYLGICQLPGGKHRRLDIFVAPKSETATALMHYTGSALFNRAIRLLAVEKGMYLSEHCLMSDVVREGSKIINGHIVDTPTEESVFLHLGLPYRRPEERDQ